MSAVVTIIAAPAAALMLLVLLRSSVGARLVAVPSGARWHDRPTPTFGGVGIFAGLAAGVAVALAVGAVDPSSELFGILAGGALLFVAGLVDDVLHLSPLAKLAAQIAAAGIAIASGVTVEVIGNDAAALAIGLLWLVGITNAFNLLDNMDGLAATLAAIACAALAVDAVTEHPSRAVLVVALSLGIACATFLRFNLRPGRSAAVFMGDSGSQLIGFTLASLTLASSWRIAGTTAASVVLPLLVLSVPILDTSLVTVRRLLERRPVTQGGRDHTSHRLVYYGLSEARAVALLAVIGAALAATGLAYNVLGNPRVTTVGVLVTFVLLVQFAGTLGDLRERANRGDALTEQPSLRALLVQPRRLAEVVIDFGAVGFSFLASYLLIIGDAGTTSQHAIFFATLPVLLGARYVAFVALGIYRRVWRFAGSRDALAIAIGTVVSEVVAFGIVAATQDFGDFPARVFLLDAFVCAAVVGGSRYAIRFVGRPARSGRRRVLLVGAGRTGRALVRELRDASGRRVVGFLDDNDRLRRRRIQGITVLGTLDEIEDAFAAARPEEVLVTIPDAGGRRLEQVFRACEQRGVPCHVVRRESVPDPRVPVELRAE